MSYRLKTAAVVLAISALTGCAYVPDTVHNHYKAPASLTKVPGAENVTVQIQVNNDKKRHKEISRTEDMLGIQFAGVYMDIAKNFKAAIDKALMKRGFHIGSGGANVQVVVKHFYIPEHMGFSTVDYTGHLKMQVKIDAVGYSSTVIIQKFHNGISFMRQYLGPGRSLAANALMEDGVNKLISNPGFIAALINASAISMGKDTPLFLRQFKS
jgi:uncharacterized lipoprotein YajG